jgi:hypothetical protein
MKKAVSKPVSQLTKIGIAGGVQAAFEELLQDQEARKNSFLVGELEKAVEDGVPPKPAALYSDVVNEFFDGVRFKLGRLTTSRSGLKLGKVFVHPDDVHVMKLRCRDSWRAVKETGWWIGQENPTDLRKMEVNAYRFIMEAKEHCDELRHYYLEAEEGFVRYARVPFLPVYLVPDDQQKWPELADILLKMVESIQSKNWISRFRGVKKLNQGLLGTWLSVAGVLCESDEDDEDFDYDSAGVSVDIGSKLLYLGRRRRLGAEDAKRKAINTAGGVGRASGASKVTGNSRATKGRNVVPEIDESATVNASTASDTGGADDTAPSTINVGPGDGDKVGAPDFVEGVENMEEGADNAAEESGGGEEVDNGDVRFH